jgi:hypothetical protein
MNALQSVKNIAVSIRAEGRRNLRIEPLRLRDILDRLDAWLLDRDPEGCGDNLKLLTRTATNTYFPQVLTVISLPAEEDELSRLFEELSGDLASGRSPRHLPRRPG